MPDWGSKRDGFELTPLGSEPCGIVDTSGAVLPVPPFACGGKLDAALCTFRLTAKHALVAAALGSALILGYAYSHPSAGAVGLTGPVGPTGSARFSSVKLDLPPREQMLDVQGQRIVGPLGSLMDFGIVGFNRCGTTSVRDWVQGVGDQVVISSHTSNLLKKGDTFHFARTMYNHIEHRVDTMNGDETLDKSNINSVMSGIKCSSLIGSWGGPTTLANYFNSTNLIINIRHPVSWFQSVYNEQLHKSGSKDWSRRDLKGVRRLFSDPWGQVGCMGAFTEEPCTDNAEFHRYLARLSKTDLGEDERKALRRYACTDGTKDCGLTDDHNVLEPAPFRGKIFLIEMSQLFTQKDDLRRDLSNYLGLDLPDMTPLSRKGYGFDGAIDICEEQYADIRGVLLMHAARASRWIIDYFLQSPDVVVSSGDYFIRTLEDWKNDPCDSRKGRDLMEMGEAYA